MIGALIYAGHFLSSLPLFFFFLWQGFQFKGYGLLSYLLPSPGTLTRIPEKFFGTVLFILEPGPITGADILENTRGN